MCEVQWDAASSPPLRLHELRHVAWEPARLFLISGIDAVAKGKGGALGQRVVVRGRIKWWRRWSMEAAVAEFLVQRVGEIPC